MLVAVTLVAVVGWQVVPVEGRWVIYVALIVIVPLGLVIAILNSPSPPAETAEKALVTLTHHWTHPRARLLPCGGHGDGSSRSSNGTATRS